MSAVKMPTNMKQSAFQLSWFTFLLSFLPIALTPAILFLTDDGHQGWDRLSMQIGIVAGGTALSFLFLLVSFVSGMISIRQRKIALLWVVPGGLVVLAVAAYLITYWIGPFWQAHWL